MTSRIWNKVDLEFIDQTFELQEANFFIFQNSYDLK